MSDHKFKAQLIVTLPCCGHTVTVELSRSVANVALADGYTCMCAGCNKIYSLRTTIVFEDEEPK